MKTPHDKANLRRPVTHWERRATCLFPEDHNEKENSVQCIRIHTTCSVVLSHISLSFGVKKTHTKKHCTISYLTIFWWETLYRYITFWRETLYYLTTFWRETLYDLTFRRETPVYYLTTFQEKHCTVSITSFPRETLEDTTTCLSRCKSSRLSRRTDCAQGMLSS